jgi:hypothetical protein
MRQRSRFNGTCKPCGGTVMSSIYRDRTRAPRAALPSCPLLDQGGAAMLCRGAASAPFNSTSGRQHRIAPAPSGRYFVALQGRPVKGAPSCRGTEALAQAPLLTVPPLQAVSGGCRMKAPPRLSYRPRPNRHRARRQRAVRLLPGTAQATGPLFSTRTTPRFWPYWMRFSRTSRSCPLSRARR